MEVAQTRDGLVTVQRMVEGEAFMLRVSPNNGKVRFDSKAMQVAIISSVACIPLKIR